MRLTAQKKRAMHMTAAGNMKFHCLNCDAFTFVPWRQNKQTCPRCDAVHFLDTGLWDAIWESEQDTVASLAVGYPIAAMAKHKGDKT